MTDTSWRDLSPEALDAEYNNRARVPACAAIIAGWAARSAAWRQSAPANKVLTLRHGPEAWAAIDLYRPSAHGAAATADGRAEILIPARRATPMASNEPAAPVVMFLHGGYWQALDRAIFGFLAPAFVQRGIAFALAGYPLAPAARIGEIVASVRNAATFLGDAAPELGLDPERIAALGHSAGGHLAAMLLTGDDSPVKTAIALSGLYDLAPIRACYVGRALGLDAAEVAAMSPAELLPRAGGRIGLAVGEVESSEYHRQLAALVEAWRGAGIAIEIMPAPGRDHFTILDAPADPASGLFQAIVEMLGEGG